MLIILGSKSKGRKQILTKAGYEFMVMDPAIDEKSIRNSDPEQLVLDLAKAKAAALLPKIHQPVILITADQVVLCNDKILEKPRDFNEAEEFLRLHSKYPAITVSSLVVTNTQTNHQVSGVDIAKIYFRPIPEEKIKIIAWQEYVLTCAGGFSLDDTLLSEYIVRIEGSAASVTGLPLELLQQLLQSVI